MPQKIPAAKILILMPTWLGDAVMATPFLRALRALYPNAHIAALAKPLAAPVLAGLPFVNETHLQEKSNQAQTLAWIKSQKFDLAILLPNSFRAAWLAFKARIPNRLGYARDKRSLLLTHSIVAKKRTPEERDQYVARILAQRVIQEQLALPPQERSELISLTRDYSPLQRKHLGFVAAMRSPSLSNNKGIDFPAGAVALQIPLPYGYSLGFPSGGFQPIPTIDYYLALAAHLGADISNKQMHLEITPEEKSEADLALAQLGIPPLETRNSKLETLITIVPGANFGSSKCWPPERFAQIADRLMDKQGQVEGGNAHVILATSPSELPIANAIAAASLLCPNAQGIGRLHLTATMNPNQKPLSIGALKQIVKRSSLMLCNDTGPRHFAAALQIPTLTLFGPTDPIWAETYSPNEKILRINVPCSPCQLKKCPIDHRCMKQITTEMVYNALKDLLHAPQAEPPEPDIDPRTHDLTI